MWQQVTDAVGNSARRTVVAPRGTSYPQGEDIDDPSALIARITATEVQPDDIDRAIEDLLGDDTTDRLHED